MRNIKQIKWITHAWVRLLNDTTAKDIQSTIGKLVPIRIKNRAKVSEKDWLKCMFGKMFVAALNEPSDCQAILNPHSAQATPAIYEEEFKLS